MNKTLIALLALAMLVAVPAVASAQDTSLFATAYAVPLGATMTFAVPGVPVGLVEIVPNADIVGWVSLGPTSLVDVRCTSGGPVCTGLILSA